MPSPASINEVGARILLTWPMSIWTGIFLITNTIYWVVFFCLLWPRRRDTAALIVGSFHMLLASVLSVAPFRSLLDADYRWQLGFIVFNGRLAVVAGFLTLGWALVAAWLTVSKARGRWLWLVAIGDIFFAANLGAAILFFSSRGDPAYQKIQFGEYFILTGLKAAIIFLLGFVLPPILSGIWALRRVRSVV